MYFHPNKRYFQAQEFFPPEVIVNHDKAGTIDPQIWRIFDWRVLWTAEKLRERFGTMVINDYLWNGRNEYRGYRPVESIIDIRRFLRDGEVLPLWSSFTSQHCFGRAIDAKFRKYTAEEIRQDIRRNPDRNDYQYITCVEENVSWLHFDTRSWTSGGILWVKP